MPGRTRRLTLILSLLILVVAASAGGAKVARRPGAAKPAAAPRADVSNFEAGADSNRAWPAGWRRGGNQPAARVELVSPGHGGERAVRLSASGTNGYAALVRVLPDSLRAGAVAVRLVAWIRTEGAGRAAMWVQLYSGMTMIPSDESSDRWPKGDTGWTRYEVLMPVLPEVQRVTFGFKLSGGGSMWADDVVLEALEPGQVPPSSPAARAYLDAALDSLCLRTVLTSQLNWGVLQRAARTQMLGAQGTAGAYDALRYALGRLDPSGELVPPVRPVRAAPADELALPRVLADEGTIGMVRMPVCATSSRALQATFADSIRFGIAKQAENRVRGWLVDLRVVSRGEVSPGLAALGPLLGNGTPLGWLRPDGRRGRWTHHEGIVEYAPGREPDSRLVSVVAPKLDVSSLPVAVLIGPRTSGAGEALALAFRGRPNTRFFGEPTAASGYARERIRLSDGAELRFATGRLTDRTGRLLEGAIVPDDSLNAALLTGGRDSLTAVALRWLHRTVEETR
jgi:hypothetical protein